MVFKHRMYHIINHCIYILFFFHSSFFLIPYFSFSLKSYIFSIYIIYMNMYILLCFVTRFVFFWFVVVLSQRVYMPFCVVSFMFFSNSNKVGILFFYIILDNFYGSYHHLRYKSHIHSIYHMVVHLLSFHEIYIIYILSSIFIFCFALICFFV